MKPGDIVTVDAARYLILDSIEDSYFILALDADIKCHFGNTNHYHGSNIESEIELWVDDLNLPIATDYSIDLTSINGVDTHGKISRYAAPLTYEAYRKYAPLVVPHLKSLSWLCTPWAHLSDCYVTAIAAWGEMDYIHCSADKAAALPAFYVTKKTLREYADTPLRQFSAEALITELQHRLELASHP